MTFTSTWEKLGFSPILHSNDRNSLTTVADQENTGRYTSRPRFVASKGKRATNTHPDSDRLSEAGQQETLGTIPLVYWHKNLAGGRRETQQYLVLKEELELGLETSKVLSSNKNWQQKTRRARLIPALITPAQLLLAYPRASHTWNIHLATMLLPVIAHAVPLCSNLIFTTQRRRNDMLKELGRKIYCINSLHLYVYRIIHEGFFSYACGCVSHPQLTARITGAQGEHGTLAIGGSRPSQTCGDLVRDWPACPALPLLRSVS
ncbi:hypothetical protein E2C01_092963 [Portunus trituberculatus]|uniref:Uncharacterized protein n=1 Tax=Portunus trituberculatus TaxID=210409 RepID=A0A5B7JS37_PORTR|nr:hypothetical protein [Portunus trituberculatus]